MVNDVRVHNYNNCNTRLYIHKIGLRTIVRQTGIPVGFRHSAIYLNKTGCMIDTCLYIQARMPLAY